MTPLRSTGPVSPPDGRARLSRLLTIFAARNVCRSIFSSSCVRGSSGLGSLEQHLREARDAGERRVDLVRDAGREQADRGHLLRQPQLLFEVGAVGDVLDARGSSRPAIPRRVWNGATARLTSSVLRSSPWPGRERHAEQRACRPATARRADCSVSRNGFAEQRAETAADGAAALDARRATSARRFHRSTRSSRSTTIKPSRQRLDDAVAELPQPLDLVGLDAELAVQPRVLERRRRLPRHGAEQRDVLAAERLAVRPAAHARSRRSSRPSTRTARSCRSPASRHSARFLAAKPAERHADRR